MPPHIAIIGAGQIGSRHLQGLTKINREIRVTVIDPNPSFLKIAQDRFTEMPHNPLIKSVNYLQSVNNLLDNVDIGIIATTANVRRSVVENLLTQKSVKYLILEKIVFQKSKDFLAIQALFKKVGTKAWVNCTRRLFPLYKKLKTDINGEVVKMTVAGRNWNLACNSIHMVDLLVFFTNQVAMKFDIDQLDHTIYPSKRDGFKELRGKFIVRTGRGDILEIIDNDLFKDDGREISITTERINYTIKESKGLLIKHQLGVETQENNVSIPLQSEISGYVVKEILNTGQSDLIPYMECMQYHIPMLDAFNEHFSKVTEEVVRICPIT